MENDTLTLVAIVAGVLVMLVIAVLVFKRRGQQQTEALRQHFGPEYERALEQHGSRARAEKELASRHKRVEELHIQPLSASQRDRFGAAWSQVQQRFVDDPTGAVMEADALVKDVMHARGYPTANFEQRVADLSVEHASTLDHYRAARTIALVSAKGEASTEELRQAMVHYRALFTDLLQAPEAYAPRLSEAPA